MRDYNLDQVAEQLGIKRRFLADYVRTHRDREGRLYYTGRAGKTKLFTPADVNRLFNDLKAEEPCRSIFPRRTKSIPPGALEELTSGNQLKTALALARKLSPKKNSSRLKSSSKTNVIRLTSRLSRPPQ